MPGVELAGLLGSSLVSTLAFSTVLLRQAGHNDYPSHARVARELLRGAVPTPHILLELLSIGVYGIVPGLTLLDAGHVVSIAAFALSSVILYRVLHARLARDTPCRSALVAAVLVIGMQVLAPIAFLTVPYRNLYLGYVPTTVYHNPTIVLLRPAALALFLLSLGVFAARGAAAASSARILSSALLVVLSTLAKPSYAICLLPGLALYCVIRHVRGRPVDWRVSLFGFLVPLILVLGFQYLLARARTQAITLEIAPFYFFREILQRLGKPAWLFPKFALSVLFPLSVLLAYLRDGIRSIPVMLSWTIFGIGAFYTYFVVEGAPATLDGNFTWSGQIALYVLFVVSLALLLERGGRPGLTWRSALCWGVFGLHVISGVLWAYSQAGRQASAWW